jgi:hypothetical protein
LLSVVKAVCNNCAGAEPFPVVPAAHSCTLAPITGVVPASTLPVNEVPVYVPVTTEIAAVVVEMGELRFDVSVTVSETV